MSLIDKAKEALKTCKIDQEGLNILTVNLRHDPERSRLVVTQTSEVGINLPGDTMEQMLANGFTMATGDGTLGN